MNLSYRKLLSVCLAGAMAIASTSAMANVTTSSTADVTALQESSQKAPPLLQNMIDKGVVSVQETFKEGPFTGWLIKNSGEYHLYWATKDNYIVAGPLIDTKGVNITQKYLDLKKPTPDYNDVFSDFEKNAYYISTNPKGDSKGVMYVFFEPFCHWCAKMFDQIEPVVAASKDLEIRWVPVSFLSAQSPSVVEYLTHAKSPYQALVEHEHLHAQHLKLNTMTPTAKTRAMLKKNSSFMKQFHLNGTPGIVYVLNGKARTTGYNEQKLSELIHTIVSQK